MCDTAVQAKRVDRQKAGFTATAAGVCRLYMCTHTHTLVQRLSEGEEEELAPPLSVFGGCCCIQLSGEEAEEVEEGRKRRGGGREQAE